MNAVANWLIEDAGMTQFDVISEDRDTGITVIRGEFGRVDKPTQNGRRYSRALMQREIDRLQPQIESRGCYGELDHPSDGKTKFARVSHLITKLKIEDDGRVMGEAELLDTPAGKIMKIIAKAKGSMGVSSRGFGSTASRQDGTSDVQEDFRLKTYDAVVDPACATARPGVYTEENENGGYVAADFRKKYPELAQRIEEDAERIELRKAVANGSRALPQSVESEEPAAVVIEKQLSERFERRLVGALSELRQDVEREVREGIAADPDQAPAASLLERVAELVRAYHKDADKQVVEDAMRAKDRKIARLEGERDKWADLGRQAGMQLAMERAIDGFAGAKAVRASLGDLSQFESLAEVTAAVASLKDDLDQYLPGPNDPKSQAESEAVAVERGRREEAVEELASVLGRLELSEREHGKALAKLQRAVDIGQALNTQAEEATSALAETRTRARGAEADKAKLEAVAPFANRVQLMGLLENVDDARSIAEIVEQNGSVAMRDSKLERIRQQVGRGSVHDGNGSVLEEDAIRRDQKGDANLRDGVDSRWVRRLAGV
jgi:hypothetical protein